MMKYLIVLILALFALSSVQAASNLECEFCDFAVSYADKFVQQNSTESEIISELEKVCKFVPESLQATCDSLVSVYGNQVIQMLVNKESPSTVCAAVKMCAAPSKIEVEGAIECTICTILVQQVEKYVENNQTESQIVSALDGECNLLPGKAIEQICDGIVTQYAVPMINYVLAKESATTICDQIQLCGSSSSGSAASSSQDNSSGSQSAESSESSQSGSSNSQSSGSVSGSGSGSGSSSGASSGASSGSQTGTSGSMKIYVQ